MPERSGDLANDPLSDRRPTSHERMAGQPWDASYHNGPRPGILDGLSRQSCVWHPKADSPEQSSMQDVEPARTLFTSPSWDCRFWALTWLRPHWRWPETRPKNVGSRLRSPRLTRSSLERLGRSFKTVLDCGLFHTFDDHDERIRYAESLASVTEHDGTLYVLCFSPPHHAKTARTGDPGSDDGPETGPHPIRQEELKAAFNPSNGWNVSAIEPDRIQTRFHDHGAPAWFATIKRI